MLTSQESRCAGKAGRIGLSAGTLLLMAMCLPSTAIAESNSKMLAGATCIRYPENTPNNPQGFVYRNFFVAFRGSAHCHITTTQEWPFGTLHYVVIHGSLFDPKFTGAAISARLCAFDVFGTTTCGDTVTIRPGFQLVTTVYPPFVPNPAGAGTFLELNFPSGDGVMSQVMSIVPVFAK